MQKESGTLEAATAGLPCISIERKRMSESERGQERKEGERGSRAGRNKGGNGRGNQIALLELQFFCSAMQTL